MKIQIKVNTGSVKKSKHEFSIFREKDFDNLFKLENNPFDLFKNLLTGKIKNSFHQIYDYY